MNYLRESSSAAVSWRWERPDGCLRTPLAAGRWRATTSTFRRRRRRRWTWWPSSARGGGGGALRLLPAYCCRCCCCCSGCCWAACPCRWWRWTTPTTPTTDRRLNANWPRLRSDSRLLIGPCQWILLSLFKMKVINLFDFIDLKCNHDSSNKT